MAHPPLNGMNSPNPQPVPPLDINLPNLSVDQVPSPNHPNMPLPAASNIPRQIPPGHVLPIQHDMDDPYRPPTTITAMGHSNEPDRGYFPTFAPIKEADISIIKITNISAPLHVDSFLTRYQRNFNAYRLINSSAATLQDLEDFIRARDVFKATRGSDGEIMSFIDALISMIRSKEPGSAIELITHRNV